MTLQCNFFVIRNEKDLKNSEEDLVSYSPGKWMTTRALDVPYWFLTESALRCGILLLNNDHCEKLTKPLTAVQFKAVFDQLSICRVKLVQLLSFRQTVFHILFPMNVSSNHWVLLDYNVVRQQFRLIDSMAPLGDGRNYTQVKLLVENVSSYFGHPSSPAQVIPSNQQEDMHNCGMFQLTNVVQLIKQQLIRPYPFLRTLHFSDIDYKRDDQYLNQERQTLQRLFREQFSTPTKNLYVEHFFPQIVFPDLPREIVTVFSNATSSSSSSVIVIDEPPTMSEKFDAAAKLYSTKFIRLLTEQKEYDEHFITTLKNYIARGVQSQTWVFYNGKMLDRFDSDYKTHPTKLQVNLQNCITKLALGCHTGDQEVMIFTEQGKLKQFKTVEGEDTVVPKAKQMWPVLISDTLRLQSRYKIVATRSYWYDESSESGLGAKPFVAISAVPCDFSLPLDCTEFCIAPEFDTLDEKKYQAVADSDALLWIDGFESILSTLNKDGVLRICAFGAGDDQSKIYSEVDISKQLEKMLFASITRQWHKKRNSRIKRIEIAEMDRSSLPKNSRIKTVNKSKSIEDVKEDELILGLVCPVRNFSYPGNTLVAKYKHEFIESDLAQHSTYRVDQFYQFNPAVGQMTNYVDLS